MYPDVWLRVVGIPAFLILVAASPAAAQSEGQYRISIVEVAPLAPNVDAMPRLPGASATEKRINARLASIDAETLTEARACQSQIGDTGLELSAEVVFASADFFAVTRQVNAFCAGAAHGAFFIEGVTFDMKTGEEVQWDQLFPPQFIAERGPHSKHGFVIGTDDLTRLYLDDAASLPAECRQAIQSENDGWFKVWPSHGDLGLILLPAGLAHANQACADPAVLRASTLRDKGFAERLVNTFIP